MPYLNVWIHAVWSTAYRLPLLTKNIRGRVFEHIKSNGYQKGIRIDRINGYLDHVHVLFILPGNLSIAKAIQLMKGESSYWINKNQLTREKFKWQDEYYAATVGEPDLFKVQEYIDGQELHHRNLTFSEEYAKLVVDLKTHS